MFLDSFLSKFFEEDRPASPRMALTKRVKPNGAGDHVDESTKNDGDSIIPAPSWDAMLVKDWKSDVGKTIFRRIFHWGPFVALFLIFYVSSIYDSIFTVTLLRSGLWQQRLH